MPDAPHVAVVRQLAPSRTLRAAINFGNSVLAQRDADNGEARGASVDLAQEIGRRLGVPVELVPFEAAGKVFEALRSATWDVAFLAIDPKRATEIEFTAPYVIIEGSYMVPVMSPLQTIADVDRPGVRIAVGNGSAYELYLSRTLVHAQLIRENTGNEAIARFLREGLEAAAGVKSPLQKFAQGHPELRVMDGRFMAIEQAVGMPKGRGNAADAALAAQFLRALVEDVKASGFVAASLTRTRQHDAQVAPAASVYAQ
ncbi:MAG: transporter substrate-binding domain-containing protein [Betaproteobacteria bacterium]